MKSASKDPKEEQIQTVATVANSQGFFSNEVRGNFQKLPNDVVGLILSYLTFLESRPYRLVSKYFDFIIKMLEKISNPAMVLTDDRVPYPLRTLPPEIIQLNINSKKITLEKEHELKKDLQKKYQEKYKSSILSTLAKKIENLQANRNKNNKFELFATADSYEKLSKTKIWADENKILLEYILVLNQNTQVKIDFLNKNQSILLSILNDPKKYYLLVNLLIVPNFNAEQEIIIKIQVPPVYKKEVSLLSWAIKNKKKQLIELIVALAPRCVITGDPLFDIIDNYHKSQFNSMLHKLISPPTDYLALFDYFKAAYTLYAPQLLINNPDYWLCFIPGNALNKNSDETLGQWIEDNCLSIMKEIFPKYFIARAITKSWQVWTPILHHAIEECDTNSIDYLIKNFPFFLDWVDDQGNTVLHVAIKPYSEVLLMNYMMENQTKQTIANSLVDHLKDSKKLDQQNSAGNTPLHSAMLFKNFELAKKLLDIGFDPNICNRDGNSPLMLISQSPAPNAYNPLVYEADIQKYLEVVDYFKLKEADFTIINKQEKTLLQLIKENENSNFLSETDFKSLLEHIEKIFTSSEEQIKRYNPSM